MNLSLSLSDIINCMNAERQTDSGSMLACYDLCIPIRLHANISYLSLSVSLSQINLPRFDEVFV